MIRRSADYPTQRLENMRGGEGVVSISSFLSPAELYEKGRLFAMISLEPGASIGEHVHEGEMEAFYVVAGNAEYNDNGVSERLFPGDTALNLSGESHSIKNIGDTPLEVIALILHK